MKRIYWAFICIAAYLLVFAILHGILYLLPIAIYIITYVCIVYVRNPPAGQYHTAMVSTSDLDPQNYFDIVCLAMIMSYPIIADIDCSRLNEVPTSE